MDSVVVKQAAIALCHHQAVLPSSDGQPAHQSVAALLEVNRRAVAQPLVFFILVVAEPIGEVFALADAAQALAVVVAEVAVFYRQAIHVFGHQRHLITTGIEVADGDAFAVAHQHRQAVVLIGPWLTAGAAQLCPVKIDGDAIALDEDYGQAQAIGPI